jgi:hypothetical protein
MAEYRWKFDLNQKHTVKVEWKFSGNAELGLDGKKSLRMTAVGLLMNFWWMTQPAL